MGPTTGGHAGESGAQPEPVRDEDERAMMDEPSPDAASSGSSSSSGSGDTEADDTLSHLHISSSPADTAALISSSFSAAAETQQPSSPPASSASSSSSSPSASRSPSASPCSSPPAPPAKRAKRLTKAQQDAELLALIDPIYLGQSPRSAKTAASCASASSSPAKRVTFHTVKVLRFPLTADASKVPGNSASFWSVGLDYENGAEGEELEVDAWERRRGRERKKGGCPEVSPEARREVWMEAQGRLKEEAEDDDGDRQLVQLTSEAEDGDAMREEEAEEEEEREDAEDDSMRDAAVGDEDEVKQSSDDAQLPSSHSHNLRARAATALPPPSPSSSSSFVSASAASAPPLLFSDVSDLTSLRSSRAKVGCSCHVAAGDRVTKVCSAPWLLLDASRRSRRKRKEEVDDDDDLLAPLHADDRAYKDDDANDAEPETEAADTEAAEERKEAEAGSESTQSLSEVACECLRAGVGCNSNTCSCFSYCCRNPHSRYLFNAGKVNAKRKRMVQRMREIRLQQSEDKERKRQQKQQTTAADHTDGGSSTSKSSSAKRRESRRKARDRAQTA